jgi:two-component system OmpR family sensor kinase
VSRFARRMTLLYAVLAFVMLVAIEAAIAGVALALVDRSLAESLEAVADHVPQTVAIARAESTLADAAFSIIVQLRTPDVDVTIADSTTHAGYHDQGPPPGFDPFGPNGDAAHHFYDGTIRPALGDFGRTPQGSGRAQAPPFGLPPVPLARSRTSATVPANALLSTIFDVPPLRIPVSDGFVVLAPTQARLAYLASIFGAALAFGLVFAAIAATLIGRYVSRQALRPLEQVVAELYRFGAGDFSLREIDAEIASEFVELARAYNAAGLQVKRAFEERAKAERDMRQFVADAAHELRTPLTIVSGYVDLLRQGLDPAQASLVFDTIRVESRRMRDLIAKLIVLARLDAPQRRHFEAVDLSRLVEEAIDAMSVMLDGNVLNLDIRSGIEVMGDPDELRDAVHNLAANAAKYAPGATIRVALHANENDSVLVIADDGPGMNENERENAFARFFRGENRGATEGSGLGLPIVRGVVERAGGTVTLETSPGAGARFTVTIPLLRRATPLAKPSEAHFLSRF